MRTTRSISGLARLAGLLLLVVASASFAVTARAADAPEGTDAAQVDDHGEHKAGSGNPLDFKLAPYLFTIVTFAIVFFILNAKVWPKVTGALDERESKIRKEIEDAESARKRADTALQQYEAALSDARAEAQKMIEEAKAEQSRYAADLKAKAEADAAALKDSAKRDIEAAKRAAIAEIYDNMSVTATSIAGKIIQKELSAADQQALVQESLGELAAAAGS